MSRCTSRPVLNLEVATQRRVRDVMTADLRRDLSRTGSELTGVDEELIGDSRVVHIMDGAGKQGGEDLQISEHSLDNNMEGRVMCCSGWMMLTGLAGFEPVPPERAWTAEHGWTGPRLQRGCCCGRPRLSGNGPPKSS